MPGEERTTEVVPAEAMADTDTAAPSSQPMADASSVGEKRKLKDMSSEPSSHEDKQGPDSDLAQYLGKPGLHPTNDLGLSLPGGELEVLWDVSNDSCGVERVWWKGALVSEEAGGRDNGDGQRPGAVGSLGPSFSLKYEKYAGFEEETRVVVFLKDHLLLDVAEAQLLEWRKRGDDYEPPEPLPAEDQVVTIGEVTAEVAGGVDIEEGLAELTKMPFEKQQQFASEYRILADAFKQKLRETLEAKGEGYVVGAEDIREMVEGLKGGRP